MSHPPQPTADRFIHVGAPKCGSTALQSWLASNRATLARHGVHYVSKGAHWVAPAKSLVGVADRISGKPLPPREWQRLVAAVRKVTPNPRSSARAIVSSEWYAGASDDAVERAVRDLDGSRMHALLFVRPLSSTLVSAWQQALKLGGRQSLNEWLITLFDEPSSPTAERAWGKHRYDLIAARWSKHLGADRVTIVILDPKNPESLFRTVEQIVAVAPGTASAAPKRTNQSLSPFESEVLLALNREFYARGGTLREYRQGVLRTFDGYVNSVRVGTPEKMRLPHAWEPRVAARNEEIAMGIERSGVNVIGDLAHFRTPAPEGSLAAEAPDRAEHAASAAGMLYSLLVTTGIAQPSQPIAGFGSQRERTIAGVRRALTMIRDVLSRRARRS
jgi:hypothetical protein